MQQSATRRRPVQSWVGTGGRTKRRRRRPGTCPPGECRNSGIPDTTPCNSLPPGDDQLVLGGNRRHDRTARGKVDGGTGRQGSRREALARPSGTIRASRQRPCGASRGGVGGRMGWRSAGPVPGCRTRTAIRESRQGPYGTPRGGPGCTTRRQGCRSGVWTRASRQFANLDKNLIEPWSAAWSLPYRPTAADRATAAR